MPAFIFFKKPTGVPAYLQRLRPRGLGSLVQLVLAGAVLRSEGGGTGWSPLQRAPRGASSGRTGESSGGTRRSVLKLDGRRWMRTPLFLTDAADSGFADALSQHLQI